MASGIARSLRAGSSQLDGALPEMNDLMRPVPVIAMAAMAGFACTRNCNAGCYSGEQTLR